MFEQAKAKLVKNSKLKTLRLIVAFNVYEQNAKGKWKFPTHKNCAYLSGDLLNNNDVAKAIEAAEHNLGVTVELV